MLDGVRATGHDRLVDRIRLLPIVGILIGTAPVALAVVVAAKPLPVTAVALGTAILSLATQRSNRVSGGAEGDVRVRALLRWVGVLTLVGMGFVGATSAATIGFVLSK